jgi:hypothetical protein
MKEVPLKNNDLKALSLKCEIGFFIVSGNY